jgi:hypothetical protein
MGKLTPATENAEKIIPVGWAELAKPNVAPPLGFTLFSPTYLFATSGQPAAPIDMELR